MACTIWCDDSTAHFLARVSITFYVEQWQRKMSFCSGQTMIVSFISSIGLEFLIGCIDFARTPMHGFLVQFSFSFYRYSIDKLSFREVGDCQAEVYYWNAVYETDCMRSNAPEKLLLSASLLQPYFQW